MGKKQKQSNAPASTLRFISIYEAANILAYATASTFFVAALQNDKISAKDNLQMAISVFLSILAALHHKSQPVKACDAFIGQIDISYRGISINQKTIGKTYSIINNVTKSIFGVVFTTALTPCIAELASKHLLHTPEFLITSMSIALAAAAATSLTHLLTHAENFYFGIKNNDFRIGVAGSSQIACLERFIFNSISGGILPTGRIPSYIAAGSSGMATQALSTAYCSMGLELNHDKSKPIYSTSAIKMFGNMCSRLANMAIERTLSRSK